jgi:SAM-dependent methyltransferase
MSRAVGDYTIPPDWGAERERLELLAAWLDPATFRQLEALGCGPGWRCLEVGPGAGTTARWMGERVVPGGHATALDVDTRFLDVLTGAPGVDVLRGDVRTRDFAAGTFDLIHARFVLEHLPDRVAVMKRMVDWLAPGGWVLFEEPDCAAALASPNPLWARHMEAYRADPGYDVTCGRVLPAEVAALGLEDVAMEIATPAVTGGTDLARWYAMTIAALRPALVATGSVSGEELDELHDALGRPGLLEPGFTVVSVRACKPPTRAWRRPTGRREALGASG